MEKTKEYWLEEIQVAEIKVEQLENQKILLLNRGRDAERRERTHRLIERGAILESLLKKPQILSNNQIEELLIILLNTTEAKQYLSSVYIDEKTN